MRIEGGLQEDPANRPTGGQWAVLRHNFPPQHPRESHWDLFFQAGSKLLSFELKSWPLPANAKQLVDAKRIADHRPLYLAYEGEVSGKRGAVKQVSRGWYVVAENDLELRTPQDLLGQQLVLLAHAGAVLSRPNVENRVLAKIVLPDCPVDAACRLAVEAWAIEVSQ